MVRIRIVDIIPVLLNFLDWVASKTYSKFLEDLVVYLAEHYC